MRCAACSTATTYLVSPTLACLPVDNATDGNTLGPAEIDGETINRLIGWCMTYLINYIGYPAATVPAGLADNGLPVGMQIVGRRYADFDVIAASAAVREAAALDGDLRALQAFGERASPQRVAAIDHESGTGNIAGGRRGKIDREWPDLIAARRCGPWGRRGRRSRSPPGVSWPRRHSARS